VGKWLMLSRLHRAAHKADVNCAPLSDVMVASTPNLETQPAKRALAQSAAVMEGSRIASGHRDVLSITVNRYVWPRDDGRGPTRSTRMCAKLG
jgi:hypothetical protein